METDLDDTRLDDTRDITEEMAWEGSRRRASRWRRSEATLLINLVSVIDEASDDGRRNTGLSNGME